MPQDFSDETRTDSRQKDAEHETVLSAEDARQGEIILRTRTRRIIFIAGLVGLVIVAVLLRISLG
jgi:hypothetical protein